MPPCILIAGTDWKLRANPVALKPSHYLPLSKLSHLLQLHYQNRSESSGTFCIYKCFGTLIWLWRSQLLQGHTHHISLRRWKPLLWQYQPSYMDCLFLLLFRNLLSCMLEKCLKQPLIGYIWTRTLSFMGVSKFSIKTFYLLSRQQRIPHEESHQSCRMSKVSTYSKVNQTSNGDK